MVAETGTSNYTIQIEDGKQVYPCRCGETHRGDYAIYDYGHHNCDHPSPLLHTGDGQLICPECGNVWFMEDVSEGGRRSELRQDRR